MEESNVFKLWNYKCDNESEGVRLSYGLDSCISGDINVTILYLTR